MDLYTSSRCLILVRHHGDSDVIAFGSYGKPTANQYGLAYGELSQGEVAAASREVRKLNRP